MVLTVNCQSTKKQKHTRQIYIDVDSRLIMYTDIIGINSSKIMLNKLNPKFQRDEGLIKVLKSDSAYHEFLNFVKNKGWEYSEIASITKSLEKMGAINCELTIRKHQLELYSKQIAGDRNNPIWYYKRSQIYQHRGEYQKGLLDINVALKLRPNFEKFLWKKAYLLMCLENWEESIKVREQLISMPPENVIHYNMIGTCLIELKRYKEARIILMKALKISPDYENPKRLLKKISNLEIKK